MIIDYQLPDPLPVVEQGDVQAMGIPYDLCVATQCYAEFMRLNAMDLIAERDDDHMRNIFEILCMIKEAGKHVERDTFFRFVEWDDGSVLIESFYRTDSGEAPGVFN